MRLRGKKREAGIPVRWEGSANNTSIIREKDVQSDEKQLDSPVGGEMKTDSEGEA